MNYRLFIARRYLRAKHKQAFTTVITIISALGISIGVMALVVASSLLTGMHNEIRSKILGTRSHITIYGGSSERTINNFQELRSKIMEVDGVNGSAPLVREEGLIRSAIGNHGVVVHGIDPAESRDVLNIFDNIVEGDWESMNEPQGEFGRLGCLIGKELAQNLGLSHDDQVLVLTVSSLDLSPMGMMPRYMKMRVAGIFETGDWQADSLYVYVPLDYLRSTLRLGEGITMLQVKIDDFFQADSIKKDIVELTEGFYFVRTTAEENTMFFEALKLEKMATQLTITLIVIVAAMNIISSLIMMVMEKNRDIGVLMSMGATRRGVMAVFWLQGLIIGVVGIFLGVVLGAGLSFMLDYFEVIKLPGEVYTITSVRFQTDFIDVLKIAGAVLLISNLATIYPAWKASRLRPSEALRYE